MEFIRLQQLIENHVRRDGWDATYTWLNHSVIAEEITLHDYRDGLTILNNMRTAPSLWKGPDNA